MKIADQLRQLFELYPEGTHFCGLENRPGFALDAESMLKLLDHHDQLQAQCEAMADALEMYMSQKVKIESIGGKPTDTELELRWRIGNALAAYRASQKDLPE